MSEERDINEILEEKRPPKYLGKFISANDMAFLQNVCQHWFQEIPKDLDPTMYATLKYETDIEVQQKLIKILTIPTL